MEKTVLDPSLHLEFLGFMVDTTKMGLSHPAQKIKKIRAESTQTLEAELVTACTFSRLLGKMNATNQVIPPAPLFYRSLQMDLTVALRSANQDYEPSTDVFLQDWTTVKGFANSPWNLVQRVLTKAQNQRAEVILVAPVWKSQPWHPLLLSLLVDWPRLLPKQDMTTESVPIMPQLAAWSISGNYLMNKGFQAKLQTSSSIHGGQKQTSLMTHLDNGIAGRVPIHFKDL